MLTNPGLQVGLSVMMSLALAWSGVVLLRALAPKLGFIDVPNQRSSHRTPTPRAGGLAFIVASLATVAVVSWWIQLPVPQGVPALWVGATIVAAAGLADDRWHLPVRVRFAAYLVAATVLVVGGSHLHQLEWPGGPAIPLGWMGVPLTLLWVVGLTNVYNFMDGIDGIAAVQAVVAAGTASLLAQWRGDLGLAVYSAALTGGAAGFLLHNWPPARIFMGDVGSAFLGYTFASLAVLSGDTADASVPFAAWTILLAPFLFDASLTLLTRVLRGERWHEAHRQHLYQRLVRRGWSHLAVTSVYLGADLLLAGLAVASFLLGLGGVPLAAAASLPLLGIFGLVRWVETGHRLYPLGRSSPK